MWVVTPNYHLGGGEGRRSGGGGGTENGKVIFDFNQFI